MGLTLYTRPDCTFCDVAYQLVLDCGVAPELCDISGDIELLRRYGRRIPVLRNEKGEELDWPFAADQVRQLLA